MRPLMFATAILAAVLFLAGSGIILTRELPLPPATSSALYPLASGLKWIYTTTGGIGVMRQVVAARQVDGHEFFEMKFVVPLFKTKKLLMRRDAEGILGRDGDVEQRILRFPMKTGDAWEFELPSWNEKISCRVMGPEEIEFMNGTRTATRLEVIRKDLATGTAITDYEWYAPEFGLVRIQATHGITVTFTLTRFEQSGKSK